MMSPRRIPARSAALPGRTELTITPFASGIPRLSAISEVTRSTPTPSCPRRTLPLLASWSVTLRTMFEGIANPIPMLPPELPGTICELIPISSPLVLISAPPELPWLIGASVCRKSSKFPAPGPAVERPLALMIPIVTVCPMPSGFPIASATSPTRTLSESPGVRKGKPLPEIFSSARSLGASEPISFASSVRPSVKSILICSAPSTT